MANLIPPEKRVHGDFDVWLKDALKDPELKREYDRLKPEFAIISAMIDARTKKGITQKELAKRMKTKQSVISRLETGNANPSLSFMKRLAEALGSKLEVKFN